MATSPLKSTAKKPVAKTVVKKVAAKAVPAKKAPARAAATTTPAKKGFPARKPGTVARARPAKITFKAPADFKPSFFEIVFATLRDGLVNGSSINIQRVRGNWTNEEAKRFNLAEYDMPTYNAIIARLGAIYAPNVLKRLPPKTKFTLVIRVNRKAADGTLSVLVKGIKQTSPSLKTPGKFVSKWFADKKDPTYRKIRKIAAILPGAFIVVQLPPAGRQKKAADE